MTTPPSATNGSSKIIPVSIGEVLDFVAETNLPTKWGTFKVRAYRERDTGREPMVIIAGDVHGKTKVPLRVHDACMTSESLGSLKCDCREQLEAAFEFLQETNFGIIVYLQQEGRGIGLANKIAAYSLQERGLDTVEANVQLGFEADSRTYGCVPDILADIGVSSISLLTNNPRKITLLKDLGIQVEGRIPVIVATNPHNENYMSIKKAKMGHILGDSPSVLPK